MKLHRFYIRPNQLPKGANFKEGSRVSILSSEVTHQIKNVLRFRTGEELIFFTGDSNEYHSSLVSYENKDTFTVLIEKVIKNQVVFEKELYLFFSLIKKDNIDWILEKGTEVGVSHFIPIVSSRSEKKDINSERAQKLLVEATEQCGRPTSPTLHPVMKLEKIFTEFDIPLIILEKDSQETAIEKSESKKIGLLIGPEGGWTPEEIELFKKEKAIFRSLGPTVLRAETAAIVSASRFL